MLVCWIYFLFMVIHLRLCICDISDYGKICTYKRKGYLDCSRKHFTRVPELFRTEVNNDVVELDLSDNRIASINDSSFRGLKNLKRLNLNDNMIVSSSVSKNAFAGLKSLRSIYLCNNNLTRIPVEPLQQITNLMKLYLDGNQIKKIESNTFRTFNRLKSIMIQNNRIEVISNSAWGGLERSLTELRLRGNYLVKVPSKALKILKNLIFLDLTGNRVTFIPKDAFSGMLSLRIIRIFDEVNSPKLYSHKKSLNINVHRSAFRFMKSLKKLELHFENIKLLEFPDLEGTDKLETLSVREIENLQIPTTFCQRKKKLRIIWIGFSTMSVLPALNKCSKLHTIDLVGNSIDFIPEHAFSGLKFIESIEIFEQQNTVKQIHENAFSHLPSLKELDLSHISLKAFPNLNGTYALKKLKLRHCQLNSMPSYFCSNLRHLENLDLAINEIQELPSLSGCKSLHTIYLFHNRISALHTQFKGLSNLHYLRMSDNHLTAITDKIFESTPLLGTLFLDRNMIYTIQENAFENINNLAVLDLSYNRLHNIPTKGLKSVVTIKVEGNKNLITFPTQEDLPHARILKLVYNYHCCFFMKRIQQIKAEISAQEYTSTWKVVNTPHFSMRTKFSNSTRYDIPSDNIEPFLRKMNNGTTIYFNKPIDNEEESYHVSQTFSNLDKNAYCTPTPNEFYPCEDLVGKQWLRVCVWIVFLLALFGNICVLLVLTANYGKLDVPRYLIINLAFADLCLGIYLGFLAFVDIITLGDFRLHALKWQFSGSCKAAGFLAVFSSELSVYTLAAITIERFTTIKNSMHVERRITKNQAVIIMSIGWIFSATLAALPLYTNGAIHFSDYSKYSVCLPFETDTVASKAYVIFLLTFNLLAFLIILCCYIKIYLFIRGSNAWNSGDSRVARRMAILVFTDFLCWFPISLVALSAVFENSLISDLWVSKVLTIFIFPLNACANPFLYAIFTKQFRKDVMCFIRHMKDKFARRKEVRKSLIPLKGSITYSTSVRRESSCSFLFSRRCSSKTDDVKVNSRITSTYRQASEEMEDDIAPDYNERLTSV